MKYYNVYIFNSYFLKSHQICIAGIFRKYLKLTGPFYTILTGSTFSDPRYPAIRITRGDKLGSSLTRGFTHLLYQFLPRKPWHVANIFQRLN